MLKSPRLSATTWWPDLGKDVNGAGGWQIEYRDDSSHGHNKSLAIKPYANYAASLSPMSDLSYFMLVVESQIFMRLRNVIC